MNVFHHFRDLVCAAVEKEIPGIDTTHVQVEPPRDPAHGDVATNAAMVLAKTADKTPRVLAETIAAHLGDDEAVESVEVAGPGFINLRLGDAFWQSQVPAVLKAGLRYGDADVGGAQAVNVEYVSANPTGPLHIGHCRGAVFGDALANLLEKAGFKVAREYYINDAGGQVDNLARSVHLRYLEALGEAIGEIPEGLYPGDYLVPIGEEIARTDGDRWRDQDEEVWLEPFREQATARMLEMIRDDLHALGIDQDVFTSEKQLLDDGAVDAALKFLRDKNLVYTGVLEPPKGKPPPEDWEPEEQTLFRASEFGDDTDRVVKKADGGNTYFASDIAYHLDKYKRGFGIMIDVWGADHGGYVKRMKAAVEAVTEGRGELDVKLCQLVKLFRGGNPVRMSKRAGDFVTLREVVDEVGRDVVRFIMLTRRNDAPLDFDFETVLEQTRDNPVWYVQYAHARCCSVMRNAAEELPGLDLADTALAAADGAQLAHADEIALIKQIAQWPRVVESAALAHEPHRLAFYLYDLAAHFHAFWNKGKEDPGLRFIIAGEPDLSHARLALVRAVATVIESGLAVMGVEAMEEMR